MKSSGFAAALIAVSVVSTGTAAGSAPPALVEYAEYSILHTLPGQGVEIRKLVKKIELNFRELERASGPHVRVALRKLRESVAELQGMLAGEELEQKVRMDIERLLTALREVMPGDGSVRAGDGSVRPADGSVRPEELTAMRTAVNNLVSAYGR